MANMKDDRESKEEALKGRAAWLDRYRKNNPEAGEEIDDDSLWDFAHSGYSELDGRYSELSGANSRLAELVKEDPRLGAALSMIVGKEKKSLPYAIASIYGKDFLEGDLDEFEAGYQENLKRLAESRKLQEEAQKNVEASMGNIEKFGKKNGLSENELSELNNGLMEFADNLLMGKIPMGLIELVHKGLHYDQDVQEAAITGEVEGRNQKIEATMRRKTESAPIPDFMGGSGSGRNRKAAPAKQSSSFYDGLMEE